MNYRYDEMAYPFDEPRPARQRRRAADERAALRQRIRYLEALCVHLGADLDQLAGITRAGIGGTPVDFIGTDGSPAGYGMIIETNPCVPRGQALMMLNGKVVGRIYGMVG
jgi:hypothetical protein